MSGYRLSQLNENTYPRLLQGIQSAADWNKKKAAIAQIWQDYIGRLPDPAPLACTVHSETVEADHIRMHLSYATGFGDRVFAFLLLPDAPPELMAQKRRFPAILALHPTDPKGKADIATSEGRDNRRYALELVSRGYVVLAPDTITAGERIYEGFEPFRTAPFYESYPESTAIGKMLHDHRQGIDLLQSLPYVDGQRIGAIGHSLGAYNACFLAGADERVKAVVSSCGFSPFMLDPTPNRWGQREWFSHIPRLTEDLNEDRIPFEFHEIFALMAPTPLFNWFTQNDTIFPNWEAAAILSLELHRLYEFVGCQDRYLSLIGNEGHDFPKHAREAAYPFLDRWLKG